MPTIALWPPKLTIEEDVPSKFDGDNVDSVTMIGSAQHPGTVTAVWFIPSWTQAGANTNFRTLTLWNRTGAGAGTTKVAELALTSGVNLTKFVPIAITLQAAANLVLAAGDILQWATTATANGAADPGGRLVIQQNNNA